MERELTIKDMLLIILKKAKQVLVWALVFCVLLGAFGAYRSYRSQTEKQLDADDQLKAAQKYQRDVEQATLLLERAQRQEQELQMYLDESLYYAIDPYNKGISSLLFYVDTGYEVNPMLNYQTPDRTGHVIAAYTVMYKNDEEMVGKLSEMLGGELDKKYIFELIDVVSAGNYMVLITVVHENADTASAIAHYIYETTQQKAQQTVAEHTTQLLADYTAYEVDTALRSNHEISEQNLENAKATVIERQEELELLLEEPVLAEPEGIALGTLAMDTAKYAVLGAVAGCAVGIVLVLLGSMMGGRLQNAAEVTARYKFPLLGILPQDTGERWFDKWIRTLEGELKGSYEDAAKVTAANLQAVAGEKKVMLVSTGDKAAADKLAASLLGGSALSGSETAAPDAPDGGLAARKLFFGGNILEDASAVEALKEADAVVLVEERGKTKIEQIDGEVLRLEALDKEILGIVLC